MASGNLNSIKIQNSSWAASQSSRGFVTTNNFSQSQAA